eukprot:TRINITY_DN2184_c0_g2_i1.p1 TRINITY_DN2184_c0_g2~~TRINITY_DN2184_c0_g2_i1.p1  ORF type:complete len:325 (-),score=20.79 TRINITY_DN2184_c0_g2_i1:83-988(-)
MVHSAFGDIKKIVFPTLLFYIILNSKYFVNNPCQSVGVFDQTSSTTCDGANVVVFRSPDPTRSSSSDVLWFSTGYSCNDIVTPLGSLVYSPDIDKENVKTFLQLNQSYNPRLHPTIYDHFVSRLALVPACYWLNETSDVERPTQCKQCEKLYNESNLYGLLNYTSSVTKKFCTFPTGLSTLASICAGLIILIYILEACQMYVTAEQTRCASKGLEKPYVTLGPILEIVETNIGVSATLCCLSVFSWNLAYQQNNLIPGVCEDRTAILAFLMALSVVGFCIEVSEFLIADPLEDIDLSVAKK